MNFNTKIKNLLRKGSLKYYGAVFGVVVALFSIATFTNVGGLTSIAQAAPPTTTAPTCPASASSGGSINTTYALCVTEVTTKNASNQPIYSFTAKVTKIVAGTSVLTNATYYYDITQDYTYSWVISGAQTQTFPNITGSSFSDGLANLPAGNYQMQVMANSIPSNQDQIQNSQVVGTVNVTVATGTSAGATATIASVTATGATDGNDKEYTLVAQLNSPTGTVISGGAQNPDTGNPPLYSWKWSAKEQFVSGQSSANADSYDLENSTGSTVTDFFAPGTYVLTAIATPQSGSPVATSGTNSLLSVGNAAGQTLSITNSQVNGSGFQYNFTATLSAGANNVAAVNWFINGAEQSGHSGTQALTLSTGNNAVIGQVVFTDGGILQNGQTLTLDSTGKTTATNGTTPVSTTSGPDACTISASGVACVVGKVIGITLGYMVDFITMLTAHLLLPITENVIGISVHSAQFSAVIIQEWVFLRNLCNIFFIATLIMVGLGTLLNIDGMNDPKKILPKLVISALLINFSLAIAQAILGVADVLQAQFLGTCSAVVQGACQSQTILENLAYRLMTAPLANVTAAAAQSVSGLSVALFTEVVYFLVAIVAVFAFAALTAYLVIRIVALWLLLMTSPIAFATSFVPVKAVAKLGSQWWDYFLKYAFFTPIIGLLLHICALLANSQSTFVGKNITNQAAIQAASGTGVVQTMATDILTALLVAACLGAALSIASSMGIYGSKEITGMFNKAKDKVFGVPKWAGNYVADRGMREIRNRTADLVNDKDGNVRTGVAGLAGRSLNAALNPDAMLKSWKKDFEGANKSAAELAQTRSDKLQFRNQTGNGLKFGLARFGAGNGIDNKADIHKMEKEEDAEVAKYLSGYNREELSKAYANANAETKPKIFAAQLQRGDLARNMTVNGKEPKPAEVTQFVQDTLKSFGPIQAKKIAKSLNHTAGEKKDLDMAYLDLTGPERSAKRMELLKSWSNDEMSKVKLSSLTSEEMDAWATKVSKGGSELADTISSKNIEAVAKIDPAALKTLTDAMSEQKLLRIDPKLFSAKFLTDARKDLNAGSPEFEKVTKTITDSQKVIATVMNQIVEEGGSDVIDKVPKAFFRAFTDAQKMTAVSKMKVENAVKMPDEFYLKDIDDQTKASVKALQKLVDIVNENPEKAKGLSTPVVEKISELLSTGQIKGLNKQALDARVKS